MKSFMTFKERSCILVTSSVTILLLTGGCQLLGPPGPNVSNSHSTMDLSSGHLYLESNQVLIPVLATNTVSCKTNVTPALPN